MYLTKCTSISYNWGMWWVERDKLLNRYKTQTDWNENLVRFQIRVHSKFRWFWWTYSPIGNHTIYTLVNFHKWIPPNGGWYGTIFQEAKFLELILYSVLLSFVMSVLNIPPQSSARVRRMSCWPLMTSQPRSIARWKRASAVTVTSHDLIVRYSLSSLSGYDKRI